MSWLRTISHYFRASTLRVLLRDLYYRFLLPSRLKWAMRNAIARMLLRRGRPDPMRGHGPWSVMLARSSQSAEPPGLAAEAVDHMKNYLPDLNSIPQELRNGRSIRDGYVRGWGIQTIGNSILRISRVWPMATVWR